MAGERSKTIQRAVCCSNGSTGGGDQKTVFPWGHGVSVCEWEQALMCFVESFIACSTFFFAWR